MRFQLCAASGHASIPLVTYPILPSAFLTCLQHGVPLATNRATAELLLSAVTTHFSP